MFARLASLAVGSGIAVAIASSSINIALAQEIEGDRLNLNGRRLSRGLGSSGAITKIDCARGLAMVVLPIASAFFWGDTTDPFQQPVAWFQPQFSPLAVRFSPNGMYRYLDITPWIEQYQWQVQPQGNTLQISTPPGTNSPLAAGTTALGRSLGL